LVRTQCQTGFYAIFFAIFAVIEGQKREVSSKRVEAIPAKTLLGAIQHDFVQDCEITAPF
jgi:hypothetical protein